MAKGRKFDTRVVPDGAGTWTAQVIRRRTSRGTVVERERAGFTSQTEASQWAVAELCAYLEQRSLARQRSKERRRHTKAKQEARARTLKAATCRELVQRIDADPEHASDYRDELCFRCQHLCAEIAWRAMREGLSENEAVKAANLAVGGSKSQRKEKARTGELDRMIGHVERESIQRARELLRLGLVAVSPVPHTLH